MSRAVQVTRADRQRLRDMNHDQLAEKLADIADTYRRDVLNAQRGMPGLLRHVAADLRAASDEVQHRAGCDDCILDKPCPAKPSGAK